MQISKHLIPFEAISLNKFNPIQLKNNYLSFVEKSKYSKPQKLVLLPLAEIISFLYAFFIMTHSGVGLLKILIALHSVVRSLALFFFYSKPHTRSEGDSKQEFEWAYWAILQWICREDENLLKVPVKVLSVEDCWPHIIFKYPLIWCRSHSS